MSTVKSAEAHHPGVELRSGILARLADYLELAKPRIALMALVTVAVGYVLGSGDAWRLMPLLHALFGIALVAVASSALNQLIERVSDAQMQRTADRPLPSGRLLFGEVLSFALISGCVGVLHLALFVNVLTALLSLATLLLYVLMYTPLKRVTSFCTAVGAVGGALPPVLGWTAATGRFDAGAFVLFAILFLWQFPHFLAIAWLYQKEYKAAGLRMLPSRHGTPRVTGFLCVAYALVLLPISLMPSRFALAGDAYFLAAVVLGLGYLFSSIRFMLNESNHTARNLIVTSLVYLPLLLCSLTWDHFRLLQ